MGQGDSGEAQELVEQEIDGLKLFIHNGCAVTINVGVDRRNTGHSEDGTRDSRLPGFVRELLEYLKKRHLDVDLIFLQECGTSENSASRWIEKAVDELKTAGQRWWYKVEKETGHDNSQCNAIMFDESVYSMEDPLYDMTDKISKLTKYPNGPQESTRKRAAFLALKRNCHGPDPLTLDVVSLHGPHSGESDKKETLIKYLREAGNSTARGPPVLIGGDFNAELSPQDIRNECLDELNDGLKTVCVWGGAGAAEVEYGGQGRVKKEDTQIDYFVAVGSSRQECRLNLKGNVTVFGLRDDLAFPHDLVRSLNLGHDPVTVKYQLYRVKEFATENSGIRSQRLPLNSDTIEPLGGLRFPMEEVWGAKYEEWDWTLPDSGKILDEHCRKYTEWKHRKQIVIRSMLAGFHFRTVNATPVCSDTPFDLERFRREVEEFLGTQSVNKTAIYKANIKKENDWTRGFRVSEFYKRRNANVPRNRWVRAAVIVKVYKQDGNQLTWPMLSQLVQDAVNEETRKCAGVNTLVKADAVELQDVLQLRRHLDMVHQHEAACNYGTTEKRLTKKELTSIWRDVKISGATKPSIEAYADKIKERLSSEGYEAGAHQVRTFISKVHATVKNMMEVSGLHDKWSSDKSFVLLKEFLRQEGAKSPPPLSEDQDLAEEPNQVRIPVEQKSEDIARPENADMLAGPDEEVSVEESVEESVEVLVEVATTPLAKKVSSTIVLGTPQGSSMTYVRSSTPDSMSRGTSGAALGQLETAMAELDGREVCGEQATTGRANEPVYHVFNLSRSGRANKLGMIRSSTSMPKTNTDKNQRLLINSKIRDVTVDKKWRPDPDRGNGNIDTEWVVLRRNDRGAFDQDPVKGTFKGENPSTVARAMAKACFRGVFALSFKIAHASGAGSGGLTREQTSPNF